MFLHYRVLNSVWSHELADVVSVVKQSQIFVGGSTWSLPFKFRKNVASGATYNVILPNSQM